MSDFRTRELRIKNLGVRLIVALVFTSFSLSGYCSETGSFDEKSCTGTSLTVEDLDQLIPLPKSTSNRLGEIQFYGRQRWCYGSQCGAWHDRVDMLGTKWTQIHRPLKEWRHPKGRVVAQLKSDKPVFSIQLMEMDDDSGGYFYPDIEVEAVVVDGALSFMGVRWVDVMGVRWVDVEPARELMVLGASAVFGGKITSRCMRLVAAYTQKIKDAKDNSVTVESQFMLFSSFDNPEYSRPVKLFEGDFELAHLERDLNELARCVYGNKGEFFQAVAKAISAYPLAENERYLRAYRQGLPRLFALNLIVPVIEDTSSEIVSNRVEGKLKATLGELNRSFEIESLADFEMSAPICEIALTLAASGLAAAKPFVGDEAERQELEAFLSDLAMIIAKTSAVGNLSEKLGAAQGLFERHATFIDSLSRQSRTHGFGVMIQSVLEHLGNNVNGRD